MSIADALSDRLFTRYGQAMYHAQCLEMQLQATLGFVYNKDYHKQSPEERIQYKAKFDRKTMGNLFADLRKITSVPENVDQAWQAVLEIRNELAHSFFWEQRALLKTESGHRVLIDYLDKMIHDLAVVDDHLCTVADQWATRRGLHASFSVDP